MKPDPEHTKIDHAYSAGNATVELLREAFRCRDLRGYSDAEHAITIWRGEPGFLEALTAPRHHRKSARQ